MDRTELMNELTFLVANVVRKGQVELALAWLSCTGTEKVPPDIPPDLINVLIFVINHGCRDVDVRTGYRGLQYFKDCLQLASRQTRPDQLLKTQSRRQSDSLCSSRPAI